MIVTVPHDRLRPQTLEALIEEFVTREGAVHGHSETPLHEQIASVREQLLSGMAEIVFDGESQTCTIRPAAELRGTSASEQNANAGTSEADEPDEGEQPPSQWK